MCGIQKVALMAAAGLILSLSPALASAGIVPPGNVTITTTTSLAAPSQLPLLSNGVKVDTTTSSIYGPAIDTWNYQSVQNQADIEAEFNLGSIYSLSQVNVSYVTQNVVGKPLSVEVWFSTNGTYNAIADLTFDSGNAATWPDSTDWAYHEDAPIALGSSVSAQYVKMIFYKGTPAWLGISEVQFQTTPEPASLALLGLGGVLVLGGRRRRALAKA